MGLIRFFTNVGPNLANYITNPGENISMYDYLGESIEQSLFMRPVDEEEVINTVTGCTKKKSSDFEDISMDTVAKVVGPYRLSANPSHTSVIFRLEPVCFHREWRLPKLYQCLKAVQNPTLQIIGQFLSYHNSQKYWKNCFLPE